MKNLLTITFLFIAGLAFAQPVRTTITDDGVNVTISTPVNTRVVPICDFHWTFVDGQLQMWIEGRNELIPGGRLGNFTISGATTQQAKLDALGAISAQCSVGGGGGLSTLYYGTTLLADGDTIAAVPIAGSGITKIGDSLNLNGSVTEDVVLDFAGGNSFDIYNAEYFSVYSNNFSTYLDMGTTATPTNDSYILMKAGDGNDIAAGYAEIALNRLSPSIEGHITMTVRDSSASDLQTRLDLSVTGLSIQDNGGTGTAFVEKYALPASQPSTTLNAKSIMTWTGNGSTTTPSFEVQPKKYVANITSDGTNAPIVHVFENTFGASIVWTRNGVGDYTGTLTGAFTDNKTWCILNVGDINNSISNSSLIYRIDANSVSILYSPAGAPADTCDDTSFQILVYP